MNVYLESTSTEEKEEEERKMGREEKKRRESRSKEEREENEGDPTLKQVTQLALQNLCWEHRQGSQCTGRDGLQEVNNEAGP